ncbi:MAG: sulfite exporter TauE/SafE family protein [Chloroflexi bacterium]|nr:MAG: sulfite exporter TauE/SafE family protein [Chloroflexota bacterium]
MSFVELLLLVGALMLAGLAKGVTGMGLPLFATPILATVLGARTAVVVMSIPIFVTNLLLLIEGRDAFPVLRTIWPIALAGAAGVLVGLNLLVRIDPNVLSLVIAALVLLVLARGDRILGDDPAALRVRVLGPVLGGISGVLMGTTSIASPAVAGYFHALRLAPRDFVVALALLFQILGTVQVLGLWRLGEYDSEIVRIALLALAPMLVTLAVGMRLRRRLDSAIFRRVISGFLALSAIVLVWQGLRGLGIL